MKRSLTLLMFALMAQGNPMLVQADDNNALTQYVGCGAMAETETARPDTSLSADFTHRFDQAQVDGDLIEAIAILRDWDQNVLLQDKPEARLEVAFHAFQLGHARHAAGDLDAAAMLLGHALEIHKEVGGSDMYAVWHELAQLHMAAKRFDFAQIYVDQALSRLATADPSAATHLLAFQQLEGDLHRLQHGYAVAKQVGVTSL